MNSHSQLISIQNNQLLKKINTTVSTFTVLPLRHRNMKAENKHSKIIAAAIKVFAKKGFFTARISDIAKEAKVADGTIYLYFNNKNDILVSIFEEELGKLVEKTKTRIKKSDDPTDMLRIFIEQHLIFMKKNRNLSEIIHVELRLASKVIKGYQAKKYAEYENIVAQIIRDGQNSEIFNPGINPDITKRIILGSLDELTKVWCSNYESHYSAEDLAFQLTETLLAGIRN